FVRAEDSSPFGAGWTFAPVNRLVSIAASGSDPAGMLWLYGAGDMRFFQGTGGTYTNPAEDNGTLVKNVDTYGITSASETGTTVTITTSTAHDFVVGQQVDIAGISPSGYDGTFTVTGVSGSTFTYTAASGLGSATLTSATATAH